jgi:hypothetical protein
VLVQLFVYLAGRALLSLLHYPTDLCQILQLLVVAEVLGLIDFELGHEVRSFLGHHLHFL